MAGGPATGCPCNTRLAMRDEIIRRAQGGTAPPPLEEIDSNMIASETAEDGTLHLWVATDKAVYLTYQKPDQTGWHGGQPGKQIAGLFPFCNVPEDWRNINGLTASRSSDGKLHLFVRYKDGATGETWQDPGKTTWSGGKTGGPMAALQNLAPAP